MAKYLFIKSNKHRDNVIALNIDMKSSAYIPIDELPSYKELGFFNKETLSYDNDSISLQESDGTLSLVSYTENVIGVLRPSEDDKLDLIIVSFSDIEEYYSNYKVCNTSRYSVKDISGIKIGGVNISKIKKSLTVFNILYYLGAKENSININKFKERRSNNKGLVISQKEVRTEEKPKKEQNKQVNNLSEEKKDLLDKLNHFDDIQKSLDMQQQNIDKQRNDLENREKNFETKVKNLSSIEKKIKVDKACIDKEKQELEKIRLNLLNEDSVVRVRNELQNQVNKLKSVICSMENIGAYQVAELVVDVRNIFKLRDTMQEEKEIIKIIPDYTYEMILKSLRRGDIISIPVEYFSKLCTTNLRYLESSSDDTEYIAIEEIKFNKNLEESIVALVAYGKEKGYVRVSIYREYNINKVSENDIATYTVEYGNFRRRNLSL